jgi:hypothetical protein
MTDENKKALEAVLELLEELRASRSGTGHIEVLVCGGKAAEVRIMQIGKAKLISAIN